MSKLKDLTHFITLVSLEIIAIPAILLGLILWGTYSDYTETETQQELLIQAEDGNIDAMYELGVHLAENMENSDGPNPKAVYWLERAAKSGHSFAQNEIGYIYLHGGYGESRDYKKALFWFQKAANNNDPEGHYNLGIMYRDGLEVKQITKKAIKHFTISANMGNPDAMHLVAMEYAKNIDNEDDIQKAIKYRALAIQNAYAPNDFLSETFTKDHQINNRANLKRLFLTNDEINFEDIFSQINNAEESGKALSKRYATIKNDVLLSLAQDLASGQSKDSVLYEELDLNLSRYNYFDIQRLIVELIRTSAEMGNKDAQAKLNTIYLTGEGVAVNKERAAYWAGYPEWSNYKVNDMDHIKFETTGCYGECPIYSVYIYSNGDVDFLGKEFVPLHGVISTKLNYDLMAQLEAMISTHIKKSLPLHDPDDCYTATDMSSTYITLHKAPLENTQEIYHYNGCYSEKGIKELAKLIYDIRVILPLRELGLDKYENFNLPSFKNSGFGFIFFWNK